MFVVSLDAAKAFDKLWREGLFFKLIDQIEPSLWRILYKYYNDSFIIVCTDGKKSCKFRTTEGVKQGGILSPFLFNFFMDGLLTDVLSLNVGAKLNDINTSILAYCDDILLLSMSEAHMNRLLNHCYEYSCRWKLEFNASKSVSYSSDGTQVGDFELGGSNIPRSKGFIYLGLPIGGDKFTEDHFSDNFRKCEKALYSLRVLGCKPNALSPFTIAFLYKQFCQSIFKYGLETLYIKKSFLNLLNVRQNILIKNVLGIKLYARSKVLMNVLNIESITQIYSKHKLYGLRQIERNYYTKNILEFLGRSYATMTPCNQSFIAQLNQVNESCGINDIRNFKCIIEAVDSEFQCNDLDLKEQVTTTLNNYNTSNSFIILKTLNEILRVNF